MDKVVWFVTHIVHNRNLVVGIVRIGKYLISFAKTGVPTIISIERVIFTGIRILNL